MPDTSKTILWVVVAAVVIALIAWFFWSASRRREAEARRAEAERLRASLDAHLAEAQQQEDRASVTARMAAEAREAAEQRRREAQQLEEAAAERARTQSEAVALEADRIDPDVPSPTGPEFSSETVEPQSGPSHDVRDRSSAHVSATGMTGGSTAVGSAAFTHEEDEEDLADAVNPFAPPAEDHDHVATAAESTPDATGTYAAPAAPATAGEPQAASAADDGVGSSSGVGAAADDADRTGRVEDSDGADTMSDQRTTQLGSTDDGTATGPDVSSTITETHDTSSLRDDSPAQQDAVREPQSDEGRTAHAGHEPTADAEEGAAGLSGSAAGATAAASGEPVATGDEESEARATPYEDADRAMPFEDADRAGDVRGEDAFGGTTSDGEGSTARTDGEGSTGSERGWSPEPADEKPTVSVPALEHTDEVLTDGGTPSDDPGDHRGQPWATTGGTKPLDADEEEGQATDAAVGARTDPDTDVSLDEPPTSADHGAPRDPEASDAAHESARDLDPSSASDVADASQPAGRRTSEYDEVVDGGYGMGSAAPLADGAQPLGHAVKGSRDGSTYLTPDDEGYDDVEPDVWFYDEDAARRAGFDRRGA